MTRFLAATLLVVSACGVEGGGPDPECEGGKCDGAGVDQTCNDPRYGDGVCQLQLGCSVPDIDCFQTFTDDTAAATWYATQEGWVSKAKGKPAPRTILPPTDPRYAQVHKLLDKGWDAFKTHRPVGKLADKQPAVVIVDDPEPNAYCISDEPGKLSAFTVVVQSGLLAVDATDDSRLGVMLHELQHAVGLHLIGDTIQRITKYYAATNTTEPIGREQTDDAAVRAAMAGWRQGASQVGVYSAAELGGLPFTGELNELLSAVVSSGQQNNPAGCAAPVQALNQLVNDLGAAADPLSGAIPVDATVAARSDAALVAIRDQCLPGLAYSFVQIVALLHNTTPEAVAAQMTPDDLALVSNRHVIDAIAALTMDRRAQMRVLEASLPYGNPWSNARYFSQEEDADDVSLFVLRAAGFAPTALGDFFVSVLSSSSAAVGQRCKAIVDGGQRAPYGVDLTDPHHAVCFRAAHLHQLARALGGSSQLATTTVTPIAVPETPASRAMPAVLPLPHARQRVLD